MNAREGASLSNVSLVSTLKNTSTLGVAKTTKLFERELASSSQKVRIEALKSLRKHLCNNVPKQPTTLQTYLRVLVDYTIKHNSKVLSYTREEEEEEESELPLVFDLIQGICLLSPVSKKLFSSGEKVKVSSTGNNNTNTSGSSSNVIQIPTTSKSKSTSTSAASTRPTTATSSRTGSTKQQDEKSILLVGILEYLDIPLLLSSVKQPKKKNSSSSSSSSSNRVKVILSVLEALEAILIDNCLNVREFEQQGGLKRIAKLLTSNTRIPESIKLKCIELIVVYLSPEQYHIITSESEDNNNNVEKSHAEGGDGGYDQYKALVKSVEEKKDILAGYLGKPFVEKIVKTVKIK